MARYNKTVLLVTLFLSQFALAGGSSSGGPSACSYSPVNCYTTAVESGPLVGQYRMYFCLVPGPDNKTNGLFAPFFTYADSQIFPVNEQVSPVVGGGITYSGNGFSLNINNDVPYSDDRGYPATLSSPAFGYKDEPILCWIKGPSALMR